MTQRDSACKIVRTFKRHEFRILALMQQQHPMHCTRVTTPAFSGGTPQKSDTKNTHNHLSNDSQAKDLMRFESDNSQIDCLFACCINDVF
ncbi:hypothetical protein DMENIID0001_118910 [Sergentomyia squamirostris]